MSRISRRSFTLAGLVVLLATPTGPAAYASVPPSDPASDGFPELTVPATGLTLGQEIGWMLVGAALVLAAAAAVTSVFLLVTRRLEVHRPRVRTP